MNGWCFETHPESGTTTYQYDNDGRLASRTGARPVTTTYSCEVIHRMMTTDLPEAPAYFSRDAQINREGPALIEDLREPSALSPEAFQMMQRGGCLVLDTRPSSQYGAGHIPGS